MVDFVDRHKVVDRKSAFLAFPNAQNGNENKIQKTMKEQKKKR
jgi:hypothetical protein